MGEENTTACICREQLERCMEAISGGSEGVLVRGLQMTDAEQFAAIKVGEDSKRKHYRALCWAARPLQAADVKVGLLPVPRFVSIGQVQ